MYVYTIIDKDDKEKPLNFISKEDAILYTQALAGNWEIIEAKQVIHLNAQSYIDWNTIPKHLNFIYRDSDGVYACQYRPFSKWYGVNSHTYRLYGGERLKLDDGVNWHLLVKVGDIFERTYNQNTFHFIRWNVVKNSFAVKFIDNDSQTIEVFDNQGKLIFSGSNDDIKMINKRGSFQFEKFPWQTYTFIK